MKNFNRFVVLFWHCKDHIVIHYQYYIDEKLAFQKYSTISFDKKLSIKCLRHNYVFIPIVIWRSSKTNWLQNIVAYNFVYPFHRYPFLSLDYARWCSPSTIYFMLESLQLHILSSSLTLFFTISITLYFKNTSKHSVEMNNPKEMHSN